MISASELKMDLAVGHSFLFEEFAGFVEDFEIKSGFYVGVCGGVKIRDSILIDVVDKGEFLYGDGVIDAVEPNV